MTAIATLAPTMTSLELLEILNAARAEFGENEVRRNDFNARCRDELAGDHYESFVVANDNGTKSEVIRLDQDQCMLVLMRESKLVRRRVLEQVKTKQAPAFAIPQTYSAALRLCADQADKLEQQAAALALAAPKVEFVDRYVDGTGLKTFREVCKLLGAKENAFRTFLASNGVMYRINGSWMPYASHIDAGRFVVKTGVAESNGHAFNTAKWTAKGVEWIAGLWAVHGLSVRAQRTSSAAADSSAARTTA